ncbi:hypothetical protein A6R68_00372, partial [Neotoma lepida]
IIRVGDNKKIHQIELIPSDQLVAVISGRNRHVRLFPMSALDGRETDFYKLAETKGCQTITAGKVRHGALSCLCVAMKRQVLCYELFQSKTRHRKFKEIQVPCNVQWMAIFKGDELVVPETSDNSRKQMVRNINNKRRYSFRVPEEERMQQR